MPDRTSEALTLVAVNAVTELYYAYADLADHVRQHTAGHNEVDVFYLRGGLKTLLLKYHAIASNNPIEASDSALPAIEILIPASPVSKALNDTVWQKIVDVRGDIKTYCDAVHAYGNQVPPEVNEVVHNVKQLIHRRSRIQSGPEVVIDEDGIGVLGDASRHYALRGGRKKVMLAMRDSYPEALSAKKCARLMGKTATIQSELIQQVSADVNDINKRFKKNLQLGSDLIINRNGYLLNFEELNILR